MFVRESDLDESDRSRGFTAFDPERDEEERDAAADTWAEERPAAA